MRRLRRDFIRWSVRLALCAAAALGRAQERDAQTLQADGVEVRLRVEPTQTTTAGRIVADLEVAAPSSIMVEIEPPAPQPEGQLSVVSATPRGPVVTRPGVMKYGVRVVFTPFLAGAYVVPAFTVSYRVSGMARQLMTKPVPVAVRSLIEGDPAAAIPSGILPIAEAPLDAPWYRSAWLGIVVLLPALIGWWLFRRRKRSMAVLPPRVGPCAGALAALEALPVPDASSLERVIECLRANDAEQLPDTMRQSYQWIRFGSPTSAEVEHFTRSLKDFLRERASRETTRPAL